MAPLNPTLMACGRPHPSAQFRSQQALPSQTPSNKSKPFAEIKRSEAKKARDKNRLWGIVC